MYTNQSFQEGCCYTLEQALRLGAKTQGAVCIRMPRVGILSWEYSTAGDWILLCPLEDVANDDAQKAHNDQEGDGETAAILAALFPQKILIQRQNFMSMRK